MALSCLSVMGSPSNNNVVIGNGSTYQDQLLTATGFGSRTRTAAYGVITVSVSATGGDNVTYGIVRMLDNSITSNWCGLNTDYGNYYDESYTSVTYNRTGVTGGEYSDSGNTINGYGSGLYYGFKNSSQVLTKFTTNYTDDNLNNLTAYGTYITVNFEANKKALLKNFTITGNTSMNWDDVPRSIIVVGSDDNATWQLIKDASDFGSLSPWNQYIGVPSGNNGYYTSTAVFIPLNTYTYPITTTKKFRYLRFVITRLIRGRVPQMVKFNLLYDIFVS